MTNQLLEKIVGTNIDPRSLLSTDYFNHFNEVIMMLNMLPDMPELLDEVDKWQFKTYTEHFLESELNWGPLAIEAYNEAPAETREKFDRLASQINIMITETRALLRKILEEGNLDKFREMAQMHSMQLQGMVDDGGSIVHGFKGAADQAEIDKMF